MLHMSNMEPQISDQGAGRNNSPHISSIRRRNKSPHYIKHNSCSNPYDQLLPPKKRERVSTKPSRDRDVSLEKKTTLKGFTSKAVESEVPLSSNRISDNAFPHTTESELSLWHDSIGDNLFPPKSLDGYFSGPCKTQGSLHLQESVQAVKLPTNGKDFSTKLSNKRTRTEGSSAQRCYELGSDKTCRETERSVIERYIPQVFGQTNISAGAGLKLVPQEIKSCADELKMVAPTSHNASVDVNTCLHNISTSKHLSHFPINPHHLKICQHTRSSLPCKSSSSRFRCKSLHSVDSHQSIKLTWNSKSPPVKSSTPTNNPEHNLEVRPKSRLAAWGHSETNAFLCRSSDDLCLFNKAISQSPPHSLVATARQYREAYASKFPELKCKYEASSDSDSSVWGSDSDTSDKFSSQDISNSDLTRGVWSRMSVSDGERTSLGFELQSCSQDERLSPSLGRETSQLRPLMSHPERDNPFPCPLRDQQHLRQMLKHSLSRPLRLLKRRHQYSFQSDTSLQYQGLKQIHKLSSDPSSRCTSNDSAEHLLSTSDELNSYSSSEISSKPEQRVSIYRQLSPALLNGKNEKRISMKPPLQRALSFPGINTRSENRDRHYLMRPQNITQLIVLYEAHNDKVKIENQALNPRNRLLSNPPLFMRKKLPEVTLRNMRTASAFRTQNNRLNSLKICFLVVLVVSIFIFCASIAFLATVGSSSGKDVINRFLRRLLKH